MELQPLRRRRLGAIPLVHYPRVHAARGPELRNLLEHRIVGVKEKGQKRGERLHIQPPVQTILDIGEPIRQRERRLLGRRRPRLPDVVPRDRHRMELRRLRHRKLDRVGDHVQGGLRRDHPLLLGNKLLQHIVLKGATDRLPRDALLVRQRDIHRVDDRRGGIDREGSRDLADVDAVEQDLHVPQRVDGDPLPADLPLAHRVIRIDPHQARHVERGRQPRLALVDEVVEPLVGLLGRPEPRKLPHRPRPAAIHRRIRTAGVRSLAREPQVLVVVDVGDVIGGVQPVDLVVRDRHELLLPLATLEERLQRLPGPAVPFGPDHRKVLLIEHTLRLSSFP